MYLKRENNLFIKLINITDVYKIAEEDVTNEEM